MNQTNLPPAAPQEATETPRADLVLGVALAGGSSRRMGHDKALLRFNGMSWIDHAAQRLAQVCDQVVIADRGRRASQHWPSIDDGEGRGPAAGILGAAKDFPQHDLLVLACDLPAVPVELLRWLIAIPNNDLVMPRQGRGFEPLCALYRRQALKVLAQQVASGNFALQQLAKAALEPTKPLTIHCIEETTLQGWGAPQDLFANLNTPQELERFQHQQSL